ncbi:MAG: hexose kinase [Anaerolineae bacterium]|nr:hexose kinase [Anaerolineae bacterium]
MTPSMLIDCVTPNAALDRTLVVPGYQQGGVFRPQKMILAAGGKGINVARAAAVLGGKARCFGFVAGHSGRLLTDLAVHEGLLCRFTPLAAGETRTCTILADPDLGMTTLVNEAGAATAALDWARLRADLLADAEPRMICFCGSLPPGSPLDSFAELLGDCAAAGHSVWVDTSGAALMTASKVRGVNLKVNDEEASALTGAPITSPETAAATASHLAAASGAFAVITLGKDGAILVAGGRAWLAKPPHIAVKSAVGSGDSFLAGLLVALGAGETPQTALRMAAAAGAANAQSYGGGQFTLESFRAAFEATTLTPVAG